MDGIDIERSERDAVSADGASTYSVSVEEDTDRMSVAKVSTVGVLGSAASTGSEPSPSVSFISSNAASSNRMASSP